MAKTEAGASGPKASPPTGSPDAIDPNAQLKTAQTSKLQLDSRAAATDKEKARVAARIKVLLDRTGVEDKLKDFDTWLRDRKIALENSHNTLMALQQATQEAAPASAEAIGKAIGKVDAGVTSLITAAQAAHGDAVTANGVQAEKAAALKAAQDANAKVQSARADAEAQVKNVDDRLKAAKDALNKNDFPSSHLALFEAAQASSAIVLPDHDKVIADLRTTWAHVDSAQHALDQAAADAATKNLADKAAATSLATATQKVLASKLAAISLLLSPKAAEVPSTSTADATPAAATA